MQLARSTIVTAVLAIASLMAAACGGNASVSPVAPSSTATGAASITGTVRGSAVTSRALAEDTFTTLDAHSGLTVSVVGTGISTNADNQGQFTLNNVPTGNVQLNFSAPGSNATVTLMGVGPDDRVQITVTVNGSSAHVDSEHHNNGEISATIKSIDGTAKTFVAGDWTIKTTNSTVIRHGGTTLQFADLKVGNHVQVRGTRDGTNVTATEIKVEQGGEGEDNDDDHNEGEVSGAVSGLSGQCPAISFTVKGITVTTDNSTTYGRNTSCDAIKNDLKVEVAGTKKSATSILARRISLDD